jgi:diacylglycerol kinase (ATP)
MICCALLALVFALPIWLLSRLRFKGNPLAWRLDAPMPLQQRSRPHASFTIAARLRSIRYAGRGLLFLLGSEHNAWLHFAATSAVIGAGLALKIGSVDWRWIAAAILWVWSVEALNTAIERICNLVSPEPDERIRVVKDVAAGAVLVSAAGAALIGAFTFLPYIVQSH